MRRGNAGSSRLIRALARWTTIGTAGLLTVVGVVVAAPPASASPVLCSGASSVFAAQANGQLLNYQNATVSTPTATWTGPKQIGTGFVGRTLAGPGSTIYFIGSDGGLLLYHYQNGQFAAGSTLIASGFQRYLSAPGLITTDSAGHILAVDASGALRSYFYNQTTSRWDDPAGTVLDTGWGSYRLIVATDNDVVYATDATGVVYRSQYDPVAGQWIEHAKQVDTGWQATAAFSPGADVIYTVQTDGLLAWRHFDPDTDSWTSGVIGSGWASFANVTATTNTCNGSQFTTLTCTASTTLFDHRANGQLWLYQHTSPTTGAANWTTARQIGSGFTGRVMAGADGTVYMVKPDGSLFWYHYDGTRWTGPVQVDLSGTPAFTDPEHLMTVDSAGQLYSVDADGLLRSDHYDSVNHVWDDAAPPGQVLASGWHTYTYVFAAGDGVVYAVDSSGALLRFRFDNDSQRWTEYAHQVATGWNAYSSLFSPGGDVIYAVVKATGALDWFHFNDATQTWDNGGVGKQIGTGWSTATHPDLSATSNTCWAPTPRPVASATPLPAPQDGRIGVGVVAPSGTLDYYYRDGNGVLTDATDDGATGLTPGPATTVATVGQFGVASGTDDVVSLRSDGRVVPVSGVRAVSPGGYFTAITATDWGGSLELYAVDANGDLWWRGMAQPDNQQLTGWIDACAGCHLTGRVSADGLFVYAADTSGDILAITPRTSDITPGADWTHEVMIPSGADNELVGTDTVSDIERSKTTGLLTVDAHDVNGGTTPDPSAHTLPQLDPAHGVTAADQQVSSAMLANGARRGIAAVGTDGFVYVANEGFQSSFGPWQRLGTEPAAGPPTMVASLRNAVDVVYRGQDGLLYHYRATTPTTVSDPAWATPLAYTGGGHS